MRQSGCPICVVLVLSCIYLFNTFIENNFHLLIRQSSFLGTVIHIINRLSRATGVA